MQDDVRANHAGLTGELRITTTPEYGSQVVVPLLAEFSQLHPGPSRAACLVVFACRSYRERFDVAIRLGTLADSRYHAALMTSSPSCPWQRGWLANHPVDSLEQLAEAGLDHSRAFNVAAALAGRGVDGHPVSFEIKKAPRLYADSARALMALPSRDVERRCCRNGWRVTRWMRGNWSRCYRRYTFAQQGIYAVYPMPGMCAQRKCEHLLILCASG